MLNELAKQVYQTAVEKGWYDDLSKYNLGEKIALMHSELSEALDEIRNGHAPNEVYFKSDGNGGQKPEGAPIEFVDAIIRIMDTCVHENIDLDAAFKLKADYNKSRPHKHGGKLF
jgi:hypothetical protein